MDTIYDSFRIEKSAVNMDAFLGRYHFAEADREQLWGLWCVLTELLAVNAAAVVAPDGKRAVCLVTLGERYDRLSELVEESGNLLMSFGMECFGMELLSTAYDRLEKHVEEKTGFVPAGREFPDAEQLFGQSGFSADWADKTVMTGSVTEAFRRLGIVWGEGMLHPQKSVLYTVSLAPAGSQKTKDGMQENGQKVCDVSGGERKPGFGGRAGHDCEACGQADCAFRCTGLEQGRQTPFPFRGSGTVYSYGISQIFGGGTVPDQFS